MNNDQTKTIRRNTLTAACILAAVLATQALAQTQSVTYRITDLGALGANGINNSGIIVGDAPVEGWPHAFTYKSGALADLGTLEQLSSHGGAWG